MKVVDLLHYCEQPCSAPSAICTSILPTIPRLRSGALSRKSTTSRHYQAPRTGSKQIYVRIQGMDETLDLEGHQRFSDESRVVIWGTQIFRAPTLPILLVRLERTGKTTRSGTGTRPGRSSPIRPKTYNDMDMERYRASKLLRAGTRSFYATKYDNKSMYRANTVPAMFSSASMSPQLRASLSSSLRPNACQGSKDGISWVGRLFQYPYRCLASSPQWTLLLIRNIHSSMWVCLCLVRYQITTSTPFHTGHLKQVSIRLEEDYGRW